MLQSYLGDNYIVQNYGRGATYVLPRTSAYLAPSLAKSTVYKPYTEVGEYNGSRSFNPDYVIIALGTNDAASITSADALAEMKTAYADIINSYLAVESKPVVCIATPIVRIDEADKAAVLEESIVPMIKELAAELNCPLIDNYERTREYFTYALTLSDKLHPNDISYPVLAQSIKCALLGEVFTPPVTPAN